jgi:hypothetical protein
MVNHLPPQAYSKETLIQAYNWLRHQPPQVQELAKTPDVLVSIFSKAQMHGDAYMNRAHMQNFKSELKSLAHMMGDFDSSELENSTINNQSEFTQTQLSQVQGQMQQQIQQAPQPPAQVQAQQVNQQYLGQQQNQIFQPQQQLAQLPQSQNLGVADLRTLMDTRSISMIQEVKNQFNLSSEAEALRLLIAIGYQKIRSDL